MVFACRRLDGTSAEGGVVNELPVRSVDSRLVPLAAGAARMRPAEASSSFESNPAPFERKRRARSVGGEWRVDEARACSDVYYI